MSKLKIEWSNDVYDCEDCGTSYSDGAIVKLDNEVILNAPASAHCMGSVNVDYVHILIALCRKLNISIEEINNDTYIDAYRQELETFEQWSN